MNNLDFLLPAKMSAGAAPSETRSHHHATTKPAEPFDQVIHRALAQAPRPAGEKRAEKPAAVKKPGPASAPLAKSTAAALPLANPDRPVPAGAAASPEPALAKVAANPDPASSDDSKAAAPDPDPASDPLPPANLTDPAGSAQSLAAAAATAAAVAASSSWVTPSSPAKGSPTAPVGNAGVSNLAGSNAIGADPTAASAPNQAPSTASSSPAKTAAVNVDPATSPVVKPSAEAGKKVPVPGEAPAKTASLAVETAPLRGMLGKAETIKETPPNTAKSTNNAVDPVLDPALALGVGANGTSAAQPMASMNNNNATSNPAAALEETLPGVTVVASATQSAASPRAAAKGAARVEPAEATATGTSVGAERTPLTRETTANQLISVSSQTELRTRALDRTHDMVALHGMQLRQSSQDTLQVVIKPGAGVQLALHLKQTGDGMEAHAVLQQGNFGDLNSHWSDLQQRLEARGIRLAPLGQDAGLSDMGGGFQQQPPPQQRSESLAAGAFAEYALAGASSAKTTPVLIPSGRGWESWA